MGKFPIYFLGIEIDNEMNLQFNFSFFMVNFPWKIRKNVVRIKERQGVIFWQNQGTSKEWPKNCIYLKGLLKYCIPYKTE